MNIKKWVKNVYPSKILRKVSSVTISISPKNYLTFGENDVAYTRRVRYNEGEYESNSWNTDTDNLHHTFTCHSTTYFI
jgi:hypothetical protein